MSKVTLEDKDLQILNTMIMEIPAKWANPIIEFINSKINEQMKVENEDKSKVESK